MNDSGRGKYLAKEMMRGERTGEIWLGGLGASVGHVGGAVEEAANVEALLWVLDLVG